MKRHSILILVALASFASFGSLGGCDRSGAKTDDKSGSTAKSTSAATEFSTSDSLIEALPFGTVAWNVRVDGTIEASIKADDAARTTGQIQWREGDQEKTANLTEDTARQTLVATGPKLSADVTNIRYTLQHDDKSVDGVLQVPPGGTAQLVADSKATPSIDEGAVGPHGGTVQAVGDDRLEIVTEGEDVHAFLVDAKLQPIAAPAGDGRVITIAAADDTPHVVTLTFDATLGGFTAKWSLTDDPTRMTIVVKKGGVVHATLAGWKPGLALAIGKKAPRIKMHAVAMGGGPKNDGAKPEDGPDHDKGKGNDKADDDKGKGKDKDGDKDKPGAKPTPVKVDVKETKGNEPKGNPGKGNDKPKSK